MAKNAEALRPLTWDGWILEFVKDQYRRCKPILGFGAASALLTRAGIPEPLPSGEADLGLIRAEASDVAREFDVFASALAKHSHFERETDPPLV
jgi:catalase